MIDIIEFMIYEICVELICDFGDEYVGFVVMLVIFGFKCGIFYGIDMFFDVCFLWNLYFELGLCELFGIDLCVVEFLEIKSDFEEVVDKLWDLLEDLLLCFCDENWFYLMVVIGCIGGWYWVVVMGEWLMCIL